ncbi:MAG: GNAT family N-acetyltransferase, partial [Acetobacteraceae bacterium]
MLRTGFHDVPPGHVAAVVTHLEMRSPPPTRPDPPDGPWPIRRVVRPDLRWYRDLYRRIGTAWLWAARLRLDDGALASLIDHPDHELWVLAPAGRDEGIAELDFRQPGACELRLFGVTERLTGTGAARAVMNHALARVWSRPGIGRF